MTQKTELFVNSVRTIPINGYSVTPTVIRYLSKSFVVGHDALDIEDGDNLPIDNFKVSLGNGEYLQLSKQIIPLPNDKRRTIVGVAQDFTSTVLDEVENWTMQNGISMPKHIMVAEPLALEDATLPGESWLSNYRSNVRRILHKFQVDFMPEPFAVFQYYRYGIRYPLITEKRRHVAIVLDFGGGTFDVSVIETTAQGDISQSGRNQKPLAAKSVAAAGYYINRCIAEYLIFKSDKSLLKNKSARRGIELYSQGKWQEGDPTINPEIYTFMQNFHRLVQSAEKAKVAICSSISQWDLAANLSAKVPVRVSVPARPFAAEPGRVEISLDAAELKDIFERDVWNKKLKGAIVDVLRRAAAELEGNPVSIVLLSGGSSNIGWLRTLIRRDLSTELAQADVLELAENFQEIVSKGLAVECARRYYTEGEGDFQAVLYNKLCLLLSPNAKGIELRKFKALSPEGLLDSGEDAVLLAAASSLRARFDQELTWKVQLTSSPNRSLEYHFMRSSFDPDDIEGQLNVVQKSIPTPKDAVFGKSIDVSLTVREDGTALPKFTYGRGRLGKEIAVDGIPFFLDMTSAAGSSNVDAYIGFDFGSSTSSFSLISKADVNVYRERGQNPSWRDLSDLVSVLPYPVASQLARYLGETSAENSFKRGRAALEAALCFLAYLTYTDYRKRIGRQTSALFKSLGHRSAGPLWALLQTSIQKVPATARDNHMRRLLDDTHRPLIDFAVNEIPKEKHDKVATLDFNRVLRPMCNLICDMMHSKVFGYFEEVRQRPFSGAYDGVFRSLKGANEPFVELYDYKGPHSFAKNQVFCVDLETNGATDMTPLFAWGLNSLAGDTRPPDLYMFDSAKGRVYSFNAVQERTEVRLEEAGPLSELWSLVQACREQDRPCDMPEGIHLTRR
ncbi:MULTISPECIES: hypothetical protein [unclassified Mesorhizobium]|uniref:hypothetical protein n=1 Tax=unclassified Mesorhizobium TaxID=325217 RepID=UPI003335B791